MLKISQAEFKTCYESNSSCSYLVVGLDNKEVIEYQVEMIKRNRYRNILPLGVRKTDNEIKAYYDITSHITLGQFLKRKKLTGAQFVDILFKIVNTVVCTRKLLLNHNSFVLDENYIFINPGEYDIGLIYLPVSVDTDIDECIKAFVLKLIIELVSFEEDNSDNYIQKILYCIRSDVFKTAKLNDVLKQLKNSSSQNVESVNNICEKNDNVSVCRGKDSLAQEIKPQTVPAFNEGNDSAGIKNKMVIGVLLQILLLAVGVLMLQLLTKDSADGDIVTIIFGIAIILAAVDFLLLRKLFAGVKIPASIMRETWKLSLGGLLKGRRALSDNKPNITKRQTMAKPVRPTEKAVISECREPATVLIVNKEKKITPYLKSIGKDDLEKIFLNKSSFLLGRLKGNVDYVINSKAVGRIHAEIICKDDKFYVKDLNSRNGTRINKTRLMSNIEFEIAHNDVLSIADCDYIFVKDAG
ncbi:MAG: DUF6382 domain-containing protein [Bacillota bacterium]